MLVINKMPRAPSAKIGVSQLITIQMKSIKEYCDALGLSPNTLLSERRLATRAHRISKDIAHYQSAIASHNLKINCLREAILKLLKEEELITEFTALKGMILSKKDLVLEEQKLEQDRRIETSLLGNGDWHLNEDDLEFLNSLMPTQESTIGPDIHCSETLLAMPPPSHVQTYMFDGSMVLPEPESQERPMKNCQRLISKSPVPNGGPDIYSRKIVLSTTSDPEE